MNYVYSTFGERGRVGGSLLFYCNFESVYIIFVVERYILVYRSNRIKIDFTHEIFRHLSGE